MKYFAVPLVLASICLSVSAAEKHRVFVLTDIENEPDDAMSMVRFLTYANHFDIEGLAATTSVHLPSRVAPQRIRRIVGAYGKVRDNLEKHEQGYPTADDLLQKVTEGLPVYGMKGVGEGKDSPASEMLIEAVDKEDPRPLWVTVWGGPNVLAQALWKVRQTRSPEELKEFVAKLRVYTIADQDDSGPWLREQFPDLFYISSVGDFAAGAYHHATWSGISGDYFHGRFSGRRLQPGDERMARRERAAERAARQGVPAVGVPDGGRHAVVLQSHQQRPERPRMRPDWGGWGGRYERYTPRKQRWRPQEETRPFWSDAEDEVLGVDGRWHTGNHATIWRWREAYQNDFAARMDWTINSYEEANHPPVAKLGYADRLTAKPGEEVQLSAEGSSDPDGDALSYLWFYYGEAGTLQTSSGSTGQPVAIKDFDQVRASFTVPTGRVMRPGTGTMHIILAVTDDGSPRLTRYRRVIVDVRK